MWTAVQDHDAFSAGFDRFGAMVKAGDFDRLPLRLRSTALQLAGQELTLRLIGALSTGVLRVCLCDLYSGNRLDTGQSVTRSGEHHRRSSHLLRDRSIPDDSGVLDDRGSGDRERRCLWRRRDNSLSARHLPGSATPSLS